MNTLITHDYWRAWRKESGIKAGDIVGILVQWFQSGEENVAAEANAIRQIKECRTVNQLWILFEHNVASQRVIVNRKEKNGFGEQIDVKYTWVPIGRFIRSVGIEVTVELELLKE